MGRFIDITGAPIASDFQEMPLEFMSKALEIQQKSQDTFDTARESIVPTEGGLRTTNIIYKGKEVPLYEYEKEKYDKPLEDVVKIAINNPAEASRRLQVIQKQRNSDPILALAKKDLTYKPTVLGQEKEAGKRGKYMTSYRDPLGKAIPIDADKILAGELPGDPSEWYKLGEHVDVIPAVQKMYAESPEIKKIIQSDLGLTPALLGAIPFYRQGKQVQNIHRKTIEDLNHAINSVEDRLLNDVGADWESWRRENGIEDLDRNLLVSPDEARKRAEKFALSEANRIAFNNSATSTDYQYNQMAVGKGGSGNGDDESGGGATLTPEGTIDTEYAKDRVELLKKTNHNTILQNAAKKLTSSRIDPINDDLFKNNPQFSTLYRKLLKPSGYVDPDKLMKADLNALIDAAGNNASVVQTLKDLQVAQVDYNTLKEVDDLADYNAKKRSGYTDTKYKSISGYTSLFTENTSVRNKPTIIIDDNGTIYQDYSGLTRYSNGEILAPGLTKPDRVLGTLPKDKIKLAQEYLKDLETNTKLKNYKKYKQEESDRLLPSVVNTQAKVETITFDKKADRETFDDMVMKAIVSAKGLGKGSHTFSNYGKADDIDLPENMDPNSIKTIGHYKNKDGYATVFTVDVPTGNGKMVKTFTLNKSTPGIVGVIDNLKGDYNIVLANAQRQISENTVETPPKGYSKHIRVNNKLVAIQSVDNNGNSNFTLEKDIIDSYNAKAKLSGKKEIKEGDSFTVDTLPIYIAIAEAPLKDAKGNILLR